MSVRLYYNNNLIFIVHPNFVIVLSIAKKSFLLSAECSETLREPREGVSYEIHQFSWIIVNNFFLLTSLSLMIFIDEKWFFINIISICIDMSLNFIHCMREFLKLEIQFSITMAIAELTFYFFLHKCIKSIR